MLPPIWLKNKKTTRFDWVVLVYVFLVFSVLCFYTFPLPSNRNWALNKDENQNDDNKDEGGCVIHFIV